MRKTILTLIFMAVFSIGMAQPVWAVPSQARPSKISVALHEPAGSSATRILAQGKVLLDFSARRYNVAGTVIVMDGSKTISKTSAVD